jgi:cellulose biosynthesis protein BcsQ
LSLSLPLPLAVLFADTSSAANSAPTWTDKEVIVAVGSVVGTLLSVGVPVVLFLIRRATVAAREQLRRAGVENRRLKGDLLQVRSDLFQAKVELQNVASGTDSGNEDLEAMHQQLQQARQEMDHLLQSKEQTEGLAASHLEQVEQLRSKLDGLEGSLVAYQKELDAERKRINHVLRKDGQTWIEMVRSNAPEFKPLQPDTRRTPIISVLNLKGGVGKTTVTANLGAALDGLGYRVLILDLDLQGSLTSLFLSDARQKELHQTERLIGDFFAASFDAGFPNLLEYIQPILPRGKSGVVPTTDQLAYAEMNMTIRWLLRDSNRDPRFLLRRELHLKRITSRYDIVLLDCPPLTNVSCVNALAASDYVLVPILPSKQATARVPVLLKRLRDFRDNINTGLNILGVLANRTHRSELTIEEHNRMSALRVACKDIWGQDVSLFDTFIRQNAEVRVAEDEHRPLTPSDEMYGTFVELAREVEARLPHFCQPVGETPAKEVLS